MIGRADGRSVGGVTHAARRALDLAATGLPARVRVHLRHQPVAGVRPADVGGARVLPPQQRPRPRSAGARRRVAAASGRLVLAHGARACAARFSPERLEASPPPERADGRPSARGRRARAVRRLAGPVGTAVRRRGAARGAAVPLTVAVLRGPARLLLALRRWRRARRAEPEEHVHRRVQLAVGIAVQVADAARPGRARAGRLGRAAAAPRERRSLVAQRLGRVRTRAARAAGASVASSAAA